MKLTHLHVPALLLTALSAFVFAATALSTPPVPAGPSQSATATATAPAAPQAVAGLKCEVKPLKDKFAFNARPRFAVTLSNVSAAPVDLIATSEDRPGDAWAHYPCAALTITRPDKTYVIQSEDGPKANAKAVRIDAGKSWSFEFPSYPETSYTQGDMPALDAPLPGIYTAEICYAVRDIEKERLAKDIVYGEENPALAGKKPQQLWEGVVRSAPAKFEVVADESPQLAILRAIHAGEGAKDLKLELAAIPEASGRTALQLRATNTRSKTIYIGSTFGITQTAPDGRHFPDLNGLRTSTAVAIAPGRTVDLTRWSPSTPGKHRFSACYETPSGKLLAESSEVEITVPPAATQP